MTLTELLKKQDPEKLRRRIMFKVKKTPDDCWEWTGWSVEGYPMIALSSGKTKRTVSVARILWLLAGNEIPSNQRIAHACGNSMCINPDHIWLEKHRGGPREWNSPPHGSAHHNAQLNEAAVREMRRLHREDRLTYVAIAEMYEVDTNTARRAIIGQTWKHVK